MEYISPSLPKAFKCTHQNLEAVERRCDKMTMPSVYTVKIAFERYNKNVKCHYLPF